MPKTFVLLHGAFHGGWCWERVAVPLRARGHRVTTPTQTGLGERRHLLSRAITLETFVDDLVNHLLFEDLTDAVLVGHSFGGNALSGAAERVPGRIAELVYLDAMVIEGGMSPFDSLPSDSVAERVRLAELSSGGLSIPPPPAAAFGVLDPADAAWLEARMTPHPLSTYRSALPITGQPGNGLPARYLSCTDPVYRPLEASRRRVASAGWPMEEIAAGHDAMITAPDALVEVLDRPPGTPARP
jgi:pimeloyl-ACP methyl ester carboxylesterase